MKIRITNLVYLILFFQGCNENSIVEVEKNKLFAKVFVKVHYFFYDPDSNSVVRKENLWFEGQLISVENTSISWISVGNDSIPYEDIYSTDRKDYGIINFYRPSNQFLSPISPKEMTIYTGIGKISGTILIPDSIHNISYNYQDTLKFGDSLRISFNGNANYYVLIYRFDGNDGTAKGGDLIFKNSQIILDSTILYTDGVLSLYSIQSFNGPYLEDGAKGNMHGDGGGFLYSVRDQQLSTYFRIKK